MLVSLTVGKVDAGVAVLLTEDKRLIEFPSILLPPSITSGSIVDITVAQNHKAEQESQATFADLQSKILDTYGLRSPSAPVLRLRNATQTSLVLEWDPIELATSNLRSLALYRNGSKAGNIPRPLDMLSTKISGLAVESEYSFQLVLRTSGGTFSSNMLTVKTHAMNNLTGITVTPGVLPPQLRESLEIAVQRIGAKFVDTVRIDTTHFVCTEGRGRDWERAVEMNIPVVRPEWIEGCEREGKIVGVRGYYLDANPKNRQVGSNPTLQSPSTSSPQTTLPTRPAATPNDRENEVVGEPGPEVPPAPPVKDAPQPPPKDDEEEADDEEEENEEEEEALGEEKHIEAEDDEEDEPEHEQHYDAEAPPYSRPPELKVEEATDDEAGGDMEEIRL